MCSSSLLDRLTFDIFIFKPLDSIFPSALWKRSRDPDWMTPFNSHSTPRLCSHTFISTRKQCSKYSNTSIQNLFDVPLECFMNLFTNVSPQSVSLCCAALSHRTALKTHNIHLCLRCIAAPATSTCSPDRPNMLGRDLVPEEGNTSDSGSHPNRRFAKYSSRKWEELVPPAASQ